MTTDLKNAGIKPATQNQNQNRLAIFAFFTIVIVSAWIIATKTPTRNERAVAFELCKQSAEPCTLTAWDDYTAAIVEARNLSTQQKAVKLAALNATL